ncbi:hypothetical protein AVEN_203383-1, partial [Araneus ventricosus]
MSNAGRLSLLGVRMIDVPTGERESD